MFYYTYVLHSRKDNGHYVGYTCDLKARLTKHNSGAVKATSGRTPFDIIYFEACKSKLKALQREKYFKSGFGRRFLKGRI